MTKRKARSDEFPAKPDPTVNKLLFSSPMQFYGMFDNENFYIHHAFSGLSNEHLRSQQKAIHLANRHYYVLLFQGEPTEKIGNTDRLNDYSPFANTILATFSVFFGKPFYSHGLIERCGLFHAPDMIWQQPLGDISLPPFTDNPRKNAGLPLNFTECKTMLALCDNSSNCGEKVAKLFHMGAHLYLRALKSYHQDPDSAYLDLVSCGEIISAFFAKVKYSDKQLFSEEILKTFEHLKGKGVETRFINLIRSQNRSIKKRFVLAINGLLNSRFFQNHETMDQPSSVPKNRIEDLLERTYDLRSERTHTGLDIRTYVKPFAGDELARHGTGHKTRDTKYSMQCLSFTGLERITRFALLSLLHNHGGVRVHSDLQLDPPPSGAASAG